MSPERTFGDRGAFLSERGLRRVNQDAVLMAELADGAELIAVADGMGGQAAGEVASRHALDVLHAALRDGADLRSAIQSANAAVLSESHGRPEYAGMGTTLVAVLRRGDSYTVANVGDSRAYLIGAGRIRQLTRDHSFIAEAGEAGGLSLAEAERSPWRNAVTRALGTGHELEVDCFGPHDAREPHTVLLCTDGLYRAVPDEQLLGAIIAAAEPAAAVTALAQAAHRAGSDDNITLAIVEFGGGAHAVQSPRAASVQSPRAPAAFSREPAESTARREARRDHTGSARSGAWKTSLQDWKFTLDYVMFTIVLVLVIYLAVAGLMGP